MQVVIQIAQLLLSLSILIVLHELGHYGFARLFGTRVEKFFLFFDAGFALFRRKVGDTVYGIGWLPLGGYVKISGMIDESMDKDQLKEDPKPWEFRAKPAYQRLLIMLGGVMMNVIVGFFIFSTLLYTNTQIQLKNENIEDGLWFANPMLLDVGFENGDKILEINGKTLDLYRDINIELLFGEEVLIERDGVQKEIILPEDIAGQLVAQKDQMPVLPRMPFVVSVISETSQNVGADLIANDKIVAVNEFEVQYADQMSSLLERFKGEEVTVKVIRDGQPLTRKLKVSDQGKLGVYYRISSLWELQEQGLYNVEVFDYSFLQAIPEGIGESYRTLRLQARQMMLMMNVKTKAYKGVGGFRAMAEGFSPSWDWMWFWQFTGIISLILAFMNILPIPALDGGHVMFILYEMISGKKPSDKFLERAQLAGMVVLLTLLITVNAQDWI